MRRGAAGNRLRRLWLRRLAAGCGRQPVNGDGRPGARTGARRIPRSCPGHRPSRERRRLCRDGVVSCSTAPCRLATRATAARSFHRDPPPPLAPGGDWFACVYPGDDKHVWRLRPCRPFAIAGLPRLLSGLPAPSLQDQRYTLLRLATMHNLRFMTMLMEHLQEPGRNPGPHPA